MTNPYAQMVKGYKDGFTNTIISQFTAEQDLDFITRGLMFRGKASIATYGSYESKRSYDPYLYALESYDELNDTYTPFACARGYGDAGRSRDVAYCNQQDPTSWACYNRTFNDKHNVGAVVIYTSEEDKNTSGGATIQATLPARKPGYPRTCYLLVRRTLHVRGLTYNGSGEVRPLEALGLLPRHRVWAWMSGEKFWELFA